MRFRLQLVLSFSSFYPLIGARSSRALFIKAARLPLSYLCAALSSAGEGGCALKFIADGTSALPIHCVTKPADLLQILLVVYQFDLDHVGTSIGKLLRTVRVAIASIELELYNPQRFERGSRRRYLARS